MEDHGPSQAIRYVKTLCSCSAYSPDSGPIIRVNPNEIHVSDPDFYGGIYHSNKWITDRDQWFKLDFIGEAIAFTTDHDLHAHRRNAVSPYFSMQSIRALEPRITAVVQQMMDRLHNAYNSGSVVNLYHLFAGYALDIITEYAFGKEGSMNFMSNPDFGKYWSDLTVAQIPNNPFARQFKMAPKILLTLPEWIVVWLNPAFAQYIEWSNGLLKQVRRVLNEDKVPDPEDEGKTVFHELKNSNLPPREKSESRLKDEAGMMVGAGGETTAQTLARTFYHLLENPKVLKKLRGELKQALPDGQEMPSLATLQHLPYLNAVVEEGVRISFPVPARSPRVFRDHALQYGRWTIQPGVSIPSSDHLHIDTDLILRPPSQCHPGW